MKALSTLLLLALASPLLAVTIDTGGASSVNRGLFTLLPQTITIDFDSGSYPSSGPAIYTGQTTNVVTGNISGVTATPPADTSAYFTVGPTRGASVSIGFAATMDYFGFYVGSLDAYNFIDLYQDNTLLVALTGTQIATIGGFPANGDQGRGIYVNIYSANSSEYFNRIVLRSTSNAFESDNHAFRAVQRGITTVASPVPEPATALLFASALLLFIYKRAAS